MMTSFEQKFCYFGDVSICGLRVLSFSSLPPLGLAEFWRVFCLATPGADFGLLENGGGWREEGKRKGMPGKGGEEASRGRDRSLSF